VLVCPDPRAGVQRRRGRGGSGARLGGHVTGAGRTGGRATVTVYVSPHGTATARDSNCDSAAYHSIGDAVSAAAPGATVVVCGGVYHEHVTVAKPMSLLGRSHPVIDAADKVNGILIAGPHVTVRGFKVTSAVGEGILVGSASYATIAGNTVTHNDLGGALVNPVPTSYAECQAAGGIPGDCGEGIHLMGSSHSTVAGNISTGNSGGILLSDETGPTEYDRIEGNVVSGNDSDCGITLAGHNPAAAPSGVPAPQVAGVYANSIVGDDITRNRTAGQGAGVLLATALPGGAVYDNTTTLTATLSPLTR
jgi:parallel beta-helix repeat protein